MIRRQQQATLLLERGHVRLQADRVELARHDFDAAAKFEDVLSPSQREAIVYGMIRANLLEDQLPCAVALASDHLKRSPDEQANEGLLDLFAQVASDCIDAEQYDRAERLLETLRQLAESGGDSTRMAANARLGRLQQQLEAALQPAVMDGGVEPVQTQPAEPTGSPMSSTVGQTPLPVTTAPSTRPAELSADDPNELHAEPNAGMAGTP